MSANFYAKTAPQQASAGGGVTSLNSETGAITLTAGTGIAITTPTSSTIQIASTSSGDVTVGAFSSSPTAAGLTINGSQVLNMDPADATHPGGVSTGAQTFGGAKTMTSAVLITPALGTPTAGVLTSCTGLPLTTGVTGVLPIANGGTNNGSLSVVSAVVYYGDGSKIVGLANGSSGQVLTSSGTTVAPTWTTPTTGTVTSVAMSVPSLLSVSGSPVTGSGTLAVTYSGTALPIANGGTGQTAAGAAFNALSPMTTGGDLIYGGASGAGTRLANGSAGQVLTSAGTTAAPTWATPTTGTVTSVALAVPAASLFSVSGSPVSTSGTLTIATAGTSGGIPYFNSTSTLNSSGALTASQVVLGGGAGAAPTSLAAGTQYQVLTMGASNPAYGAVNLAQSAAITGTLPIGNGGGYTTVGGKLALNYTAQTTTYSAVAGDYVDATSGTFTVTLPTAASISGQPIYIKNSGTGVLTIATTSSQTIDGLASAVLKMGTKYDEILVVSDGTNWKIAYYGISTGAQYSTNAGNSPTSGAVIDYEDVVYDPQSAVTTGGSWKYTAPIAGKYLISAYNFTTDSITASNYFEIGLRVNGSLVRAGLRVTQTATGSNVTSSVTALANLAATDYVDIINNSSATRGLLNNGIYNYISIIRVSY